MVWSIPIKQSHLHHIDAIRAFAMMMGIPFHVGMIYSTGADWFITSDESSFLITILAGAITCVRMPAFFMMAGLLSALVLDRRDRLVWLKKRLVRLLLPLATSVLLISPMAMVVIAHQTARQGDGGTWPEVLAGLLTTTGYHWIGHLWFLIVLTEMSLVIYLLAPYLPRIRAAVLDRFGGPDGLGRKMALAFCLITIPYSIAVTLFFEILPGVSDPIFQVAQALEIEGMLKMLPYFLAGALLYGQPLARFHTDRLILIIAAVALAAFSVAFVETGVLIKLILYVGRGIAAPLVCWIAISYGARKWAQHNRYVQHLTDASFTVYLFHYPICVALGYFLVQTDLNIYLAFTLNVCVTLMAALLCHEAISRSRVARFLFNGETAKR